MHKQNTHSHETVGCEQALRFIVELYKNRTMEIEHMHSKSVSLDVKNVMDKKLVILKRQKLEALRRVPKRKSHFELALGLPSVQNALRRFEAAALNSRLSVAFKFWTIYVSQQNTQAEAEIAQVNHAANNIISIVRGFLCRKYIKKLHSSHQQLIQQKIETAAIRIQTVIRARISCRQVCRYRKQRVLEIQCRAVIFIQKIVRGFLGRIWIVLNERKLLIQALREWGNGNIPRLKLRYYLQDVESQGILLVAMRMATLASHPTRLLPAAKKWRICLKQIINLRTKTDRQHCHLKSQYTERIKERRGMRVQDRCARLLEGREQSCKLAQAAAEKSLVDKHRTEEREKARRLRALALSQSFDMQHAEEQRQEAERSLMFFCEYTQRRVQLQLQEHLSCLLGSEHEFMTQEDLLSKKLKLLEAKREAERQQLVQQRAKARQAKMAGEQLRGAGGRRFGSTIIERNWRNEKHVQSESKSEDLKMDRVRPCGNNILYRSTAPLRQPLHSLVAAAEDNQAHEPDQPWWTKPELNDQQLNFHNELFRRLQESLEVSTVKCAANLAVPCSDELHSGSEIFQLTMKWCVDERAKQRHTWLAELRHHRQARHATARLLQCNFAYFVRKHTRLVYLRDLLRLNKVPTRAARQEMLAEASSLEQQLPGHRLAIVDHCHKLMQIVPSEVVLFTKLFRCKHGDSKYDEYLDTVLALEEQERLQREYEERMRQQHLRDLLSINDKDEKKPKRSTMFASGDKNHHIVNLRTMRKTGTDQPKKTVEGSRSNLQSKAAQPIAVTLTVPKVEIDLKTEAQLKYCGLSMPNNLLEACVSDSAPPAPPVGTCLHDGSTIFNVTNKPNKPTTPKISRPRRVNIAVQKLEAKQISVARKLNDLSTDAAPVNHFDVPGLNDFLAKDWRQYDFMTHAAAVTREWLPAVGRWEQVQEDKWRASHRHEIMTCLQRLLWTTGSHTLLDDEVWLLKVVTFENVCDLMEVLVCRVGLEVMVYHPGTQERCIKVLSPRDVDSSFGRHPASISAYVLLNNAESSCPLLRTLCDHRKLSSSIVQELKELEGIGKLLLLWKCLAVSYTENEFDDAKVMSLQFSEPSITRIGSLVRVHRTADVWEVTASSWLMPMSRQGRPATAEPFWRRLQQEQRAGVHGKYSRMNASDIRIDKAAKKILLCLKTRVANRMLEGQARQTDWALTTDRAVMAWEDSLAQACRIDEHNSKYYQHSSWNCLPWRKWIKIYDTSSTLDELSLAALRMPPNSQIRPRDIISHNASALMSSVLAEYHQKLDSIVRQSSIKISALQRRCSWVTGESMQQLIHQRVRETDRQGSAVAFSTGQGVEEVFLCGGVSSAVVVMRVVDDELSNPRGVAVVEVLQSVFSPADGRESLHILETARSNFLASMSLCQVNHRSIATIRTRSGLLVGASGFARLGRGQAQQAVLLHHKEWKQFAACCLQEIRYDALTGGAAVLPLQSLVRGHLARLHTPTPWD